MSKQTTTQYLDRLDYAKTISEFNKRVILVALSRSPDYPTGFVIQGGTVCDAVWERMEKDGSRFRALAAFKNGVRIPVPPKFKRGYGHIK